MTALPKSKVANICQSGIGSKVKIGYSKNLKKWMLHCASLGLRCWPLTHVSYFFLCPPRHGCDMLKPIFYSLWQAVVRLWDDWWPAGLPVAGCWLLNVVDLKPFFIALSEDKLWTQSLHIFALSCPDLGSRFRAEQEKRYLQCLL